MVKKPIKFKSDLISTIITIESRQSRLGDIFYYVEYTFENQRFGHAFKHLSSAIDFVQSNFQ